MFSHPVYLFLREFSLQDSRGGSERRIIDKIDENRDKASENQKWIIGLLILSILIPLLIALVTK
ncbi:hypothetical protein D9H47_20705 [Escherichia coli]|nr:hypothetical protein [Escherichia coli]EEW2152215.1 hypothetical protein [Escherichia coli]EFA5150333.1 hypothetical protein [Escherichia coli]EFN5325550.1 hypothetical protein [Escherichia coli]MHS32306.1 hypothetical protein [Escherichia coli]